MSQYSEISMEVKFLKHSGKAIVNVSYVKKNNGFGILLIPASCNSFSNVEDSLLHNLNTIINATDKIETVAASQ